VAPLSDKIKNSMFHLQNQARPLYLNVHFCKILAPISRKFNKMIFRTCPLISFSCVIQSMPPGEKQQTVI